MKPCFFAIALLSVLMAYDARDVNAEPGEKTAKQEGAKGKKEPQSAAARYFTNTELVDQNGVSHRFYNDLVKGRKVLINFAFSSCKGVCPMATANLARVRRLLGKRADKEVTFLTLTVDPVNDTPEVLKQFAKKFDVGAGWYFLTGTPDNVKNVLARLGGLFPKPEDHSAVLLVGNDATGHWVKSMATASPESIVYLLDHIDDEPKK